MMNLSDKILTVENSLLKMVVDYSDGLVVKELSHKNAGAKMNENLEIFELQFMGQKLTAKDYLLEAVTTAEDSQWELCTFLLTKDELGIKMRIHIYNDRDATINILMQPYDEYIKGVPYECEFHSPLLAALKGAPGENVYYYPAGSVYTPYGKEVMKPMREPLGGSDVKLPYVLTDQADEIGFSVSFPFMSDLGSDGAIQNIDMLFYGLASKEDVENHKMGLSPERSFNDAVEFQITGLKNGWVEAFDRYRDFWMSSYEFSEYDKPDLQWFNECVVHNFVFFYGKEGFDFVDEKIDVEGLIAQGEEFGGYDTVTVWNQYPRLGIDKRTQWDFYDDFPGGRAEFRRAVDEFHKHGIKVFMPYIPWDAGNHESVDTLGDEFAKLIADTDADGYQLDTMNSLPESFRLKLNDIKPGIIITTQQHPRKKRPMEIITTSWDEFWYGRSMPEIDVFRFLFPRHLAPVISRWNRKEDKDHIINRAKFGAAPILIWQDIFGRWMPFSEDQKAAIKQYKEVYLDHRSIYQGNKPIPLLPVKLENLYCNVFRADGDGMIYSFYNDSDAEISGEAVKLVDPKQKTLSVVLGDGSAQEKNGKMIISIPPRTVVHVLSK